MINKRYLKYTLLLFTFGMTACSDFLDEVNHSSQSADKYYQTKGGYESLIVGCYSNLKNIYNTTTDIYTTRYGCLHTELSDGSSGNESVYHYLSVK